MYSTGLLSKNILEFLRFIIQKLKELITCKILNKKYVKVRVEFKSCFMLISRVERMMPMI